MAILESGSLAAALETLNGLRRSKPEERWRIETYNILGDLLDTVFGMQQYIAKTQFDEQITVEKSPQFIINPVAALSDRRNIFISSSTSPSASFLRGELALHTGTGETDYIKVITRERGEYVAGSEVECGIGIRLSRDLEDNEWARWGYYDDLDGFGWQARSDGIAIFVRTGGEDTFISQSSWNEDKLDGSGDSSLVLDLLTGSVFVNRFAWYGYGDSKWLIPKTRKTGSNNLDSSRNRFADNQLVHIEKDYTSGASIYEPNLPITVEAHNSTTDNPFTLFVGGRQVSQYTNRRVDSKRFNIDVVEQHTLTVANNVWEPILAMRPRESFNGRQNPVNVRVVGINVQANNAASIRITADADVTGSTWSLPDTYTATETAVETAALDDIAIGGVDSGSIGFRIPPYFFVPGSSQGNQVDPAIVFGDNPFSLGISGSVVVWAKAPAASSTTIDIALEWSESF